MLLRSGLQLLSPAGPRARLSVLIFHRALAAPDPMFPSEMHAARFDELCGWLRRWFHVLPLQEGVERLARGELPERALAISFDDGYEDNHRVAMPILKRHGMCATFFIATGFLDGGRMWNDSVVGALRMTAQSQIDVTTLGLPGIDRLELPDLASRRHAALRLLGATKYLPAGVREATVERLVDLCGVRDRLPADLMMSSQQVRQMRDAGMQIGAHTQSHPILAGLDDAAALAELRGSREHLESLLQQEVAVFAYPNGKPGTDYSLASVCLARQAGFRVAVSTAWGSAHAAGLDMLQVPRFTPWDQTRTRFGLRLLGNLRRDGVRLHA